MTCLLHVYSLGTPAESVERDVPESDEIRMTPKPDLSILQATADELTALVEQADAQFVGLLDARQSFREPDGNRLRDALRSAPDAAGGLLAFAEEPSEPNPYLRLPPRLAGLVAAPQRYGLVVVNPRLLSARGFQRGVSNPLWDWTVRAAAAGESLVVTSGTTARDDRFASEFAWPALAPSGPDATHGWLLEHIRQTSPADLVAHVASQADATALKAGVLQVHDALEESHQASQSVQGEGRHRAADYWHAIMHRREPDYSNSKYWFRRVQQHPLFERLAAMAADVLEDGDGNSAACAQKLGVPEAWDPFAFVDLCAACEQTNDPRLTEAAQRIQWAEMLLLLEATVSDAEGR